MHSAVSAFSGHRHEGELKDVNDSMGADTTGALGRLFGVYDAPSARMVGRDREALEN